MAATKPAECTQPAWGKRVRATLRTQGRTAQWLCRQTQINQGSFSILVRGVPDNANLYPRLSDDKKAKIALALGMPAEFLFRDSDA